MLDKDKESMLLSHDKDIGLLANSIEHLAISVGDTNKKLDDVIDVMNTQNIIIERMDNMDNNLKESFGRIHDNIEENSKGLTGVRKDQRKFVPSSTIMWGLGFFIVYSVAFSTYVVSSIHNNDNAITELRGENKRLSGIIDTYGLILSKHEDKLDEL